MIASMFGLDIDGILDCGLVRYKSLILVCSAAHMALNYIGKLIASAVAAPLGKFGRAALPPLSLRRKISPKTWSHSHNGEETYQPKSSRCSALCHR
jgi:hypothetical protein